MSIRPANESDFETLQKLNQQIFYAEINAADPVGWDSNHPYNPKGIDYLSKAIKKNGFEAFVYEVNDDVIGYIILNIISDEYLAHRKGVKLAQINTFCVDENYRSKGVGTTLVSFAKIWAKDKGADHLKVIAIAGNQRAEDFYEANGFSPFEVTYEMPI